MSSISGSDSDSDGRSSDCSDSETGSDYSVGKPDSDLDVLDGSGPDNEASPLVQCLLCPHNLSLEELFDHLKVAHNFDMFALREKFRMDQISFIKLVNFIRRQIETLNKSSDKDGNHKEQLNVLIQKIFNSSSLWEGDEYLQPVIEEDPVLSYWFEFEGNEDDLVNGNQNGSNQATTAAGASNILSGGDNDMLQLQAENLDMKRKIQQCEDALSQAFEEMKLMKDVMSRVVGEQGSTKKQILNRYAQALTKHNAEYFESYDSLQIHDTMINDTQRTEAYQSAILNNATDFKNKIVLDVGCGTSILSMFAAKAGASKVYAVDQSKILEKAVEIVRENDLQETIECVRGTVESISLPSKVDIIISEFMGYFLLFEGMLSSYLDARKKFLKPGGAMYPNTADIFLVGIDEFDKFEENSKKWDNVYGFKMTTLKVKQKSVATVDPVKADVCVTDAAKVLSLDLVTCEYEDASFKSDFELSATKDSVITAVVGYFDVGFTMGCNFKNTLSTAPQLPETHWYQSVMTLEKPIAVKTGDKLNGVFECRPNVRNPRSLDLTLTISGDAYTYILD